MSKRSLPGTPRDRLALGRPVRSSYTRLAIADGVYALGFLSVVCGLLGAWDDAGDALVLVIAGAGALLVGHLTRGSLSLAARPVPGRILVALALSWLVLVVLGTLVYLATGTIERVDNAFVEAAAGFSTVAMTTVDPTELTLPMQLWRGATQWLGGLIGVVVGVVALPLAFRGTQLNATASHQTSDRLAPTPTIGGRRVAIVYSLLTGVLGIGYIVTGLGPRDAAVHAMTTISTGGFSSQLDSFAGFGTGPRTVATLGMIVGGSSFFVIWWIIRGRLRPVWRSTELRLYLGLLASGAITIALGADDISILDASFTAASALSTTGYAVGDWTVFDDALLVVLLVLISTGSMASSAGGGLRVVRAWTLVGFARRELRRQLDPHSIVVVKQADAPIGERILERTTGYQIAHIGLCGVAAFALAAAGLDVVGAIYTGASVISTHGPGVGAGPYGDISDWSPAARLLLTPFMLAGRMTILPLLLAVSSIFAARRAGVRQARRFMARRWRR
ncbi:MAG: potassium transporter TrkG [Acidimicrobiales bacterium]